MSRRPKERPYIRSVKRISEPGAKPRYRITVVDAEGKQKQYTDDLVSETSSYAMAWCFLQKFKPKPTLQCQRQN